MTIESNGLNRDSILDAILKKKWRRRRCVGSVWHLLQGTGLSARGARSYQLKSRSLVRLMGGVKQRQ